MVEDSPVGVVASVAAGMTAIGFVVAATPAVRSAGVRTIISGLRAPKSAIIDLVVLIQLSRGFATDFGFGLGLPAGFFFSGCAPIGSKPT